MKNIDLSMSKQKRLGRPVGSTKEDTLARIMPVARHLFADKGYAQTTFKDVGKEVGISHAAMYTYFTSKKDLYLATFAQTQALLVPHFIAAFTQGTTLMERVRFALLAVAIEHDKDPSITGFLTAVPIEMRRHEELFEALTVNDNPVMNVLESIVEDAKAKGEIVLDISASDLIGVLLGGGVGVSLLQYGMRKPNLKSTMEVFINLIEARLFATPIQ
jgi:AcrR family transcriptional regulator